MTTLSIALATYNGAPFLREQLDSLARQSRLPDELIVGDDGSTDGTLEIIRAFAAEAPFKVVVLPPEGRLGYRANFMRCAAHCTGDLIAFCDQDDVWDADKIDVVSRLITSSTLLLQHDFRVVNSDQIPLPGNMTTVGISATARWAPVLGLVQVFRRSLLEFWPLWASSVDQNRSSERMAHDQWVYFLAQALGGVQLIGEPLLSYRQHGRNTCGLERHGISHDELRPKAVMIDMLRGRPQTRHSKKTVIVQGLKNLGPAAAGRAAVVSGMLQAPMGSDRHTRLRRELRYYAGFAAYCDHRLNAYQARSHLALMSSLLRNQPRYLARGSRGWKDFLLDAALNA